MSSGYANGSLTGSEAVERVALYMRVSSEEQKTKESIRTQDTFLEEYCRLYGHEVVSIYKDEAVSGTVPMRDRPGGRKLLEAAAAKEFDAVLVYKLDRIGRSLLVVVDVHDRLLEAGIALRSATEPIDTTSPAGRLIFQMLASFAEFERATITERSRDGLRRAFENGKQLGRIPYGYDIDKDGAFAVVEEEAVVIREIIANMAGGSTLYSEAKRLNDEGMPSPGAKYRGKPRKHGASWAHTSIRGIVGQGAYSGTHTVNAHHGPVERKVPAIVAPEVQRKALDRLRENKRYSGGKPGREYLLRSLVWCEECGTAYTGGFSKHSGRDKKYYKYRCRKRTTTTYHKHIRGLSCPSIKAEWLEGLIWRDVRGFLKNPGEILGRVREQLENEDEGKDLQERRASLEKRLKVKQKEKSRYVKLYAQGHMDEDELEVYLADLKNQIENLRLLIASVEADFAATQESEILARSTEAWMLTLGKNLEEVEAATDEAFERRRELVKLLVEKIVVGRDEEGQPRVDVTYRFGEPPQVTESSVDGVRNTEEFGKAHGQGGSGGLLTGHPKMGSYEVAVERTPGATA